MHVDSRPRVQKETPAPGVLALWLHRPERRNAIDPSMVSELLDAFHPGPARAIVIGSSDPRCFCSGADRALPNTQRARMSDRLYELYERMVRCAAPIIAALEGPAVGAGAQLAVAADLRVAAPTASLRFVGPANGLAIGAWALAGLVGRGRALELCMTMRAIEAPEALAAGLVNRVEPDPRGAAVALAATLAELDDGALGRIKRVAHRSTSTFAALADERRGNRESWLGAIGPPPGGPGR